MALSWSCDSVGLPPSRMLPEAKILMTSAPFLACRSEEHTSELQSPYDLVCRLLLEKKKSLVALQKARRDPPGGKAAGVFGQCRKVFVDIGVHRVSSYVCWRCVTSRTCELQAFAFSS